MKVETIKIQLEMARQCVTTHELAKAAGLPTQTINGAIRGCNIRPATLGRIARALAVDPADILASDDGDTRHSSESSQEVQQ